MFAAKKNLRLLVAGGLPDPRAQALDVRTVAGGFLVAGSATTAASTPPTCKVVTKRTPTDARDRRPAVRLRASPST